MATGITQVRLDDGTVVWARISESEQLQEGDGAFVDSGAGERVADMAGGIADVVRGVAGSLRAATRACAPDEVSVEFGIELSARSGAVLGLLADGHGAASIKVALTWHERTSGAQDTDDADGDS